jgi:predicted acylesterase/phospholipase RssA
MDKQTRFFRTCLGVFEGGGCRAVGYAGALIEAESRGVGFAGVAGTSAGSIVAALIGAGASSNELLRMVQELDFLKLLRPPEETDENEFSIAVRSCMSMAKRFGGEEGKFLANALKFGGLYSSKGLEEWVSEKLNEILGDGKGRVKFSGLPIPTTIVAADVLSSGHKIWSTDETPNDEVAFAVRCSCSIPGYFQPVHGRYVDGGILSNLPAFVFAESLRKPLASRILAFTLVAQSEAEQQKSSKAFFTALANTIVDGAAALQGRLVHPVHYIRISTGDLRATDFDKMNKEKISWLQEKGRTASKEFFDGELGNVSGQGAEPLLVGEDEIFAAVTESLNDPHVGRIIISDSSTRWAYKLFPLLASWNTRRCDLTLVLAPSAGRPHDEYQRRLLRALGAEIHIVDKLPFRGFVINPDQTYGRAVIYNDDSHSGNLIGRMYQAPLDQPVIVALANQLKQSSPDLKRRPSKITLRSVPENEVLGKLRRNVAAYGNQVVLSTETIGLDRIIAMTNIVKGYKFRQIEEIFKLYARYEMTLFEPAAIYYDDELWTIATPPVVEQISADQYVIVQGNTRVLYALKSGMRELRCIVAKNLSTPLPTQQKIPLRNVLIGSTTVSVVDRYGSSIDRDFRNIEEATHLPSETLNSVIV